MKTHKLFILSAWLFCSIPCAVAIAAGADVNAAKGEGTVTWYTQPGFSEELKEPLAEWRRRYPEIKLNILEASGSEVLERIRAERRAGRMTVDVATLGDTSSFDLAKDDAYEPLPAADLPNSAKLLHRLDPLVDPQRRFLPTTLFMHGINVNTSLLKEADWPHSWADLLSPKYKNKLVLHDISRFGGGLSWFMVGRSVLGDDYFRKLAAQNPRIFARVQEEDSAVVRGERPVATPGRSRVKKDFAGSPITWIVPTDGVFFVPIVSGLIRGAAHPNASKLFLDFLLDPATQRSFAATGDIAVISGVENVIDLDTAKFLGNGFATAADLSAISSSVAAANEILGR